MHGCDSMKDTILKAFKLHSFKHVSLVLHVLIMFQEKLIMIDYEA